MTIAYSNSIDVVIISSLGHIVGVSSKNKSAIWSTVVIQRKPHIKTDMQQSLYNQSGGLPRRGVYVVLSPTQQAGLHNTASGVHDVFIGK